MTQDPKTCPMRKASAPPKSVGHDALTRRPRAPAGKVPVPGIEKLSASESKLGSGDAAIYGKRSPTRSSLLRHSSAARAASWA
jgi:hypothetical protein